MTPAAGAADHRRPRASSDLTAPHAAPPPKRAAERAARRGGGGRVALVVVVVVVVDASAIARKFLIGRLEALGYRALGVANGEQALAAVAREAFAVVFTELAFEPSAPGPARGIDGPGLCHAIGRRGDEGGGAR